MRDYIVRLAGLFPQHFTLGAAAKVQAHLRTQPMCSLWHQARRGAMAQCCLQPFASVRWRDARIRRQAQPRMVQCISGKSDGGASCTSQQCGDKATTIAGASARNLAESSPDVTIIYRGQVFKAPAGTKLRTAMLCYGRVSPHNGRAQIINCRGLGTCGTCAVDIRQGSVGPPVRSTVEGMRLSLPPFTAPHSSRLRLACQVYCQSASDGAGPLEVTKYSGFWGQGDQQLGVLPAGDFTLPLGPLEFVMDPDAPAASSLAELRAHNLQDRQS